ncbi:hypothetical protein C4D60_Mb06t13000 [Musa balbisiana]|uniref:Beta-glucosidase n=1 Tax=Musa balbisiana TaxID=52838 RepID=A0A4S8IML6_MUSBA|nr:hypothetical protein C4D60_Mb06t13000 [Musa balbisiana]
MNAQLVFDKIPQLKQLVLGWGCAAEKCVRCTYCDELIDGKEEKDKRTQRSHGGPIVADRVLLYAFHVRPPLSFTPRKLDEFHVLGFMNSSQKTAQTELDGCNISRDLQRRLSRISSIIHIHRDAKKAKLFMALFTLHTHTVTTTCYNILQEDVKLTKEMGLDSYRFSISWSRILPKGTLLGGVNPEEIKYYNNLINELLKNGIRPFVTLFHWDVPQALEDAYGGFQDHEIVNDFKDFASICFEEFGDRVEHWITLNEPWSFSSMGYTFGRHAPGRCSSWYGCTVGDSSTEPYTVTHNLILAHAEVVKPYKEKFQATQKGEIGITLNSMWYEPYSKSHHDKEAANSNMDPLVYGDYPFIMRALVRERLPYFTHTQSEMIKGSYDFIGINYYTSRYAQHDPVVQDHSPGSSYEDQYVRQLRTAEIDEDLPLEQAREDPHRQDYLAVHFAQLLEAIREGVRVKGHFTWSLTNNFEWDKGYT